MTNFCLFTHENIHRFHHRSHHLLHHHHYYHHHHPPHHHHQCDVIREGRQGEQVWRIPDQFLALPW